MTKAEWEKIIGRAMQIIRVDDDGQPTHTKDTARQLSFEFSTGGPMK